MHEGVRALEYVIEKDDEKRSMDAKRRQIPTPNLSMPLQDFYINKEDNLNPRYTFENFVVGPFNELAHAAASTVIKTPGQSYNPLFIYGSTGRGKTHLIQAVGNHIKKTFPHKKVFYLTSERFGTEYLNSIQENKVNQFKERYCKQRKVPRRTIPFL
jgi:chromosomal replication initiator protein